ncbi:MAG: ABC transporter ATP-binding protein [Paludibacter sp. 47-17]|nr:MAG: ABC transporter ATP-binding protein [Paludibacter sp. SCN 50-10]OJX88395.1 MAG: ABC transporter ATP-binding protein [Paludibacter sp. 47-17]
MIEVKNLSFYYRRQRPLFTSLNLEMKSGRIVGLLGRNGAGKTTLLQLMAGLLAPKGGEIRVDGRRPFDRLPGFLTDVYMVPEEFSFPHVTIEVYTKAFSPFYPRFDRQKLDAILAEFQLKADEQLNKLSHGQRKKFLIAFALASNCRLMILDEPTNGLDIPSKSQFRKILVSSVSDEQLVIISTHQVKDVDTIIDTVTVVDEGRLIFNEATDEITSHFYFERIDSLDGEENILYQEAGIGGYRVMRPADGVRESHIDLELLFNAIISNALNQKQG